MRKISIILVCVFAFMTTHAQNQGQFRGKPIVNVFANYGLGFGEKTDKHGFGGQTYHGGFELSRAYLGYEFMFNSNLSGKVVFDMGKGSEQSSLNRTAYVKFAMLSWKKNDIKIDAGLIGLKQFSVQEKFWGYRYIARSFNDMQGFGTSADLGISIEYNPFTWLSADLSFLNGGGYKKIDRDNKYKYGLGVTAYPTNYLVVRAYVDLYQHKADSLMPTIAPKDIKDRMTSTIFVGYENKYFSLGAEYNYMLNSGFVKDKNRFGFSVYSTVYAGKNWNIFGRFDSVDSKDDWNIKRDEKRIMLGMEYNPYKYLSVSPNITIIEPVKGKQSSFVNINVQFKI